jgi:protein-L-isoaspartate(D-aspartate) O-methyltransferase
MFDSAVARRNMVDGQVRTADVTSPELISAMLTVPRERFVPPSRADQAYLDGEVPVAEGRALLRPMVFAKLLQASRVRREDSVLDVGCGAGYSSAVLARLSKSVVALEEDATMAREARKNLAEVNAGEVALAVGPLIAGWPSAAPYDLIFLDGATEIVPQTLGDQLKPDGRLTCIFGRPPASRAMIFHLIEGELVGLPIFDAAGPILPGFVAPAAFVF